MFTGLDDPSLWVAVAFFGFVALLLYYGVPAQMAAALDSHADKIRHELAEAKRLRDEAQALLNEYKRKQHDAEAEAAEIIALAQQEAETLAAEASRKLAEQIERRTRQAEEKIARAESQAMNEVRVHATQLSIRAAEQLLRSKMAGSPGDDLIARAIAELPGHLPRR